MSDTVLTLRELFQIALKDVSVRAEPGIEVYQAVQDARQTIAKESRAIRWPWVRQAVSEQTRQLLNLNVLDAVWSKISNAVKRLGFQSYDFLGQLLSKTSRACTIRVRRSSLGRLWNDLGSHACLHDRNRRPGYF
jgi:hypothetical protein